MFSSLPLAARARLALAGLTALTLTACGQPASEAPDPDAPLTTVYVNGDIVTMNDASPMAESLAVRDGLILAVGDATSVKKASGGNVEIRDLDGKTLIPGMIDAHGHFGFGAIVSTMADLQPPPAGPVSNFSDLKASLIKWRAANPEATWIVGMGYDDSLLSESRHPVREDLDQIAGDMPIMLIHVSGHLATCNSACLAAAGITAETPDPDGGIIRRKTGTQEPDGVLEETAMALVQSVLPLPEGMAVLNAMERYQTYYASHGITTAQDGATSPEIVQALRGLAGMGKLKMDVVAYHRIGGVDDFTDAMTHEDAYQNHFRIGGIKLILDGSPQGKTAWLTQPYHVVPDGADADYHGYPIMKDEDVQTLMNGAFSRGMPVLAHANGDAAADQLLNAVTKASETTGQSDHRTVMIHAQTARDDQIDVMKTEGVIPSYFASHTYYWGDWHRDSVLGEARASRISPLKSSLDKDVTFTLHNDAPVVPPDMMRLIWTAVNRETRSGKTLGADQKISASDALKAVTLNAAYQYFEENRKGSLKAGKLADMVILSANPLTAAPETIKDIKVIETIKEGDAIYTRGN